MIHRLRWLALICIGNCVRRHWLHRLSSSPRISKNSSKWKITWDLVQREKVVIMSKTASVKSKSSTTDSRPAWNPSTAVTNKSAQLQSLPGKKRQFANVQSRIRSGIGNRSSNMSHDASNSYRERNDSSAVAACLYPTDHQSPWPAPKELNNTAIGSTDEVPEAKTPARCVWGYVNKDNGICIKNLSWFNRTTLSPVLVLVEILLSFPQSSDAFIYVQN